MLSMLWGDIGKGRRTSAPGPDGAEGGSGTGAERWILILAQVLEKSGFSEDFCLDSASSGLAPASSGFAGMFPSLDSMAAGNNLAIGGVLRDCPANHGAAFDPTLSKGPPLVNPFNVAQSYAGHHTE